MLKKADSRDRIPVTGREDMHTYILSLPISPVHASHNLPSQVTLLGVSKTSTHEGAWPMRRDRWLLRCSTRAHACMHPTGNIMQYSTEPDNGVGLQVTLLGVSKDLEACGRMANAQMQLNPEVQYACLKHEHFEPFTVATQPFEQLSHAVLQWLVQNQNDCDVVQVTTFLPPFHRSVLFPSRDGLPAHGAVAGA